jgi:hypothetical protein
MKHGLKCFLFGMVLMTFAGGSYGQQTQIDYESEIKRVRQELMRVQEERERTSTEKEKDVKDFNEYRKKALKSIRDINHQTDSIRQLVLSYSSKNDSLAAVLNQEKDRIKSYEIMQEQSRQLITSMTSKILSTASLMPPSPSSRFASALNLLKNDLSGKTADNIEAITRLFQIIRDMHETSSSIQVIQGTSPLPELRGTIYRIRIGSFYESAVNASGTQAAIWSGYDSTGTAKWSLIDNPEKAAMILRAVNVREGKSLPSLVQLPLNGVCLVKTLEKHTNE